MWKRWQFWVGLVISIFFVYLALRNLHLADVWQAMKTAKYWWLVPGVAVYILGVWVRTWRWHYLLRPLKKIHTPPMFPIVCIGYMGNNIYPARAGEVLRAVILTQLEGVSVSASLATIIVERVFDAVVMLGFVFFSLPQLTGLDSASGFIGSIRELSIIGAIVFAVALAGFFLAAMFPQTADKTSSWFIDRLVPRRFREPVRSFTLRFIGGLESLRSPLDAVMILFTTVLIWLLETGKYWFVMHAFPFEVSFFALMLMNGIVNLSTTLPSAPGYIGTFDAPGIAVLTAYHVAPEVAAGYTLVLHGALWFPITLLGAYYYLRQPLRWGKEVQDMRREEPQAGSPESPHKE